jgi:alpha-D-xyloside xylohydrolase
MAIVDFTNPGAVKWYLDKLEALIDLGVDCFKVNISYQNHFYVVLTYL